MVNDPANEKEDAEDVVAAQDEAAARADAFQTWWSGPFGEAYRNFYKKVNKVEAYEAFRAGWAAVLEEMVKADDYDEDKWGDPVDDFLPSSKDDDEDEGVNDWVTE